MDREKVINGLEHCGFGEKRGCSGCPYGDECGDFGRDAGVGSLCTDALALLREQELVKPKVAEWLEDSDPGQEYGTTWACRKCMHSIHKPYIWNPYDSGYKYCFHCGARMEVRLNAQTD